MFGAWIAETRERLLRGETIDLQSGLVTFCSVRDEYDLATFFDDIEQREGSVAAIHCRRNVCNSLAKNTRGAYQAIEELAAKRLAEFASCWDVGTDGIDRLQALRGLFNDCFHKAEIVDGEATPSDDAVVTADLTEAAALVAKESDIEAARRILSLSKAFEVACLSE